MNEYIKHQKNINDKVILAKYWDSLHLQNKIRHCKTVEKLDIILGELGKVKSELEIVVQNNSIDSNQIMKKISFLEKIIENKRIYILENLSKTNSKEIDTFATEKSIEIPFSKDQQIEFQDWRN